MNLQNMETKTFVAKAGKNALTKARGLQLVSLFVAGLEEEDSPIES